VPGARTNRVVRLALGLTVFASATALLMSGWTPPGVAGEVIRHNQALGLDASPLFYSDVEDMVSLEASARTLHERQAHPASGEARNH